MRCGPCPQDIYNLEDLTSYLIVVVGKWVLGTMIGRVSPDRGAEGIFSTRDFRETVTKKQASELDLEGWEGG